MAGFDASQAPPAASCPPSDGPNLLSEDGSQTYTAEEAKYIVDKLERKRRQLDEEIARFKIQKEKEFRAYENKVRAKVRARSKERANAEANPSGTSSVEGASIQQGEKVRVRKSSGQELAPLVTHLEPPAEPADSKSETGRGRKGRAGDLTPPHHREDEFHGLFTPNFLPLLDSTEAAEYPDAIAQGLAGPVLRRSNSEPPIESSPHRPDLPKHSLSTPAPSSALTRRTSSVSSLHRTISLPLHGIIRGRRDSKSRSPKHVRFEIGDLEVDPTTSVNDSGVTTETTTPENEEDVMFVELKEDVKNASEKLISSKSVGFSVPVSGSTASVSLPADESTADESLEKQKPKITPSTSSTLGGPTVPSLSSSEAGILPKTKSLQQSLQSPAPLDDGALELSHEDLHPAEEDDEAMFDLDETTPVSPISEHSTLHKNSDYVGSPIPSSLTQQVLLQSQSPLGKIAQPGNQDTSAPSSSRLPSSSLPRNANFASRSYSSSFQDPWSSYGAQNRSSGFETGNQRLSLSNDKQNTPLKENSKDDSISSVSSSWDPSRTLSQSFDTRRRTPAVNFDELLAAEEAKRSSEKPSASSFSDSFGSFRRRPINKYEVPNHLPAPAEESQTKGSVMTARDALSSKTLSEERFSYSEHPDNDREEDELRMSPHATSPSQAIQSSQGNHEKSSSQFEGTATASLRKALGKLGNSLSQSRSGDANYLANPFTTRQISSPAEEAAQQVDVGFYVGGIRGNSGYDPSDQSALGLAPGSSADHPRSVSEKAMWDDIRDRERAALGVDQKNRTSGRGDDEDDSLLMDE